MNRSIIPILIAVFIATRPSFAEENDDPRTRENIQAALSESLDSHMAAMQSLAEPVKEALNKKIEFAKTRGNLELLEKAEGELDSFVSTGRLPTLVRTAVYERSRMVLQRKMLLAYDDAISAFVKAGLIDDAKLVREDKSRLELEIDEPLLGPYTGKQLISNPGCERTLPNGAPLGWTVLSGNWTQRHDEPKPASGNSYFYAGQGKQGQITQVIDIRPIAKYVREQKLDYKFTAKLRSWGGRPPDAAEAFIEFWNARQDVMLSSHSTGIVTSNQSWVDRKVEGKIPVNTAFVRIRLVSTRHDGTDNDGYFDDLTLSLGVSGQ